MINIPPEYNGREQTWLKHLILKEYLTAWAYKLSSYKNELWYVDCFSGPWKTQADDYSDSSIIIALKILSKIKIIKDQLKVNAIFIDENKQAYNKLERIIQNREQKNVEVNIFQGKFENHVGEINRLVGNHPALVFIDPTGWQGAELKNIAPVLSTNRDVLINFMLISITERLLPEGQDKWEFWTFEEPGIWRDLSDRIQDMLEVGTENPNPVIKQGVLDGLDKLIKVEKDRKGILNDGVIEAATESLSTTTDSQFDQEERQQGALSLWELEAVEKAYDFLQKSWGTPIKKISGADAMKILKMKIPVDIKPH